MNIVTNFLHLFSGKKIRAFVIDDTTDGADSLMEVLEPLNIETDRFTDEKKLLFSLHAKKKNGYSVGVIHENGSKYKPQILCQFIRQIDPTITLIICKDACQLRQASKFLVLT